MPRCCFHLGSQKMDSLAFGYGKFLARGSRIASSRAVGRRQKKGVSFSPLKVCWCVLDCFLVS